MQIAKAEAKKYNTHNSRYLKHNDIKGTVISICFLPIFLRIHSHWETIKNETTI